MPQPEMSLLWHASHTSSITVKLHANQEIGVPGQNCWGGGNKKSGRRAAAVGEIPHFYLLSIVTKGMRAVKNFCCRTRDEPLGNADPTFVE